MFLFEQLNFQNLQNCQIKMFCLQKFKDFSQRNCLNIGKSTFSEIVFIFFLINVNEINIILEKAVNSALKLLQN